MQVYIEKNMNAIKMKTVRAEEDLKYSRKRTRQTKNMHLNFHLITKGIQNVGFHIYSGVFRFFICKIITLRR
jgi:hypothetical protein